MSSPRLATLVIAAAALVVIAAPARAATVTLRPVADTYTSAQKPKATYGSLDSMKSESAPVRNAYLRFDVQGLTTAVTKATLRVYAPNNGGSTGESARAVANNSWAESTTNYNNAPSVGTELSHVGAYSAGTWVSFDVTPQVTGNGLVSLALTTTSTTSRAFDTRESSNPPQLVLQTDSTSPTPDPTPTPTPTPTPPPSGSGQTPALDARALVGSVCANVHWTWTDTVYGNWTAAKQAVLNAGLTCLRDQVDVNSSTQRSHIQELASLGVKHDMLVDGRYSGASTASSAVSYMLGNYANALLSVEGENEPDNAGRCSIAKTGLADIWNVKQTDPRMAGIPVLGPAMANPANYASCLGDQSSKVNVGNMHSYPGGENPEAQVKGSTWSLAGFLSNTKSSYPGKPIWSTETGYHNAVNCGGCGHRPAPEAVAGTYGVQLPFQYALRGVDKAFFYELVDDGTNATDIENNFGLYRNDWSPKPLATGLHNLTTLLKDSSAAPMSGLDYAVSGPSTMRKLLLQKSDGSWWLALWNDVRIWDAASATPISQPTTTAQLTFPTAHNLQVYIPRQSTATIDAASAATSMNVSLPPADVVLVKVS